MTHPGLLLLQVDAIYYRMKALHEAAAILAPAQAREGRFHRDGQPALYLSHTPEGTAIATRRYVAPGSPARGIFPLHVTSDRIVDLRDPAATAHFGIDVSHRAAEWQAIRAQGLPSPTWDISDRVRALGLEGMLYLSRSDPTKLHLTLFAWNHPGAAVVRPAGHPLTGF